MSNEEGVTIRKGIRQMYYVPRTGYGICNITYIPELDKYYGVYTDKDKNVIQYNSREELEHNYRLLQEKQIPEPPVNGVCVNKMLDVLDPKCQKPSHKKPQHIETQVLQWMDTTNTIILCEIVYHPIKGYLGSFFLDGREHSIKHQYDMQKNWILMSEGCKPDIRVEETIIVKTIFDLSKEELDDLNIIIVDDKQSILF